MIALGRRTADRRDAEAVARTFGGLDPDQVDELEDMPTLTRAERNAARDQDRLSWRTPALATLARPTLSPIRRAGLFTLRAYLVLAVALVVVKIAQTGIG